MNEEPYNEISQKCMKSIRTNLSDIPSTKQILEELRFSLHQFKQSNYTEYCKTQTKE